jgi:hypothetical protein
LMIYYEKFPCQGEGLEPMKSPKNELRREFLT